MRTPLTSLDTLVLASIALAVPLIYLEDQDTSPAYSIFAADLSLKIAALYTAAKATKAEPIDSYRTEPDTDNMAEIHRDWSTLPHISAFHFLADMDIDCDGVDISWNCKRASGSVRGKMPPETAQSKALTAKTAQQVTCATPDAYGALHFQKTRDELLLGSDLKWSAFSTIDMQKHLYTKSLLKTEIAMVLLRIVAGADSVVTADACCAVTVLLEQRCIESAMDTMARNMLILNMLVEEAARNKAVDKDRVLRACRQGGAEARGAAKAQLMESGMKTYAGVVCGQCRGNSLAMLSEKELVEKANLALASVMCELGDDTAPAETVFVGVHKVQNGVVVFHLMLTVVDWICAPKRMDTFLAGMGEFVPVMFDPALDCVFTTIEDTNGIGQGKLVQIIGAGHDAAACPSVHNVHREGKGRKTWVAGCHDGSSQVVYGGEHTGVGHDAGWTMVLLMWQTMLDARSVAYRALAGELRGNGIAAGDGEGPVTGVADGVLVGKPWDDDQGKGKEYKTRATRRWYEEVEDELMQAALEVALGDVLEAMQSDNDKEEAAVGRVLALRQERERKYAASSSQLEMPVLRNKSVLPESILGSAISPGGPVDKQR
ncbi:hypothetical protein B0H17DRAFT_1125090 [Mycena rosella]|uniref:Uncharacterized protein n=1 Tax=Mycena rosella TaxID=1033263 RepID=A0AAD7MAU5_MYCRO|nr:hypothetical protein B0H17DRAFT_1125090 [Mycena rosella]